jgi:hypothetical protein
MDARFTQLIGNLALKAKALMEMAPLTNGDLPTGMPKKGVYLFSEDGVHMYAGRSNNLSTRYRGHYQRGPETAAFAFQLTREKTNNLKAAYKSKGSREWLMKQLDFAKAFTAAKARIRQMEFRYVEEDHQIAQTLLEIYVAVILKPDITNSILTNRGTAENRGVNSSAPDDDASLIEPMDDAAQAPDGLLDWSLKRYQFLKARTVGVYAQSCRMRDRRCDERQHVGVRMAHVVGHRRIVPAREQSAGAVKEWLSGRYDELVADVSEESPGLAGGLDHQDERLRVAKKARARRIGRR